MYYIYMLRCEDNSIYTGITIDINRRLKEHITRSNKCAKYTLNHQVLKLEKLWITENRRTASRLEYHLKKLTKAKKEMLISNKISLEDIFSEKFDCSSYIIK